MNLSVRTYIDCNQTVSKISRITGMSVQETSTYWRHFIILIASKSSFSVDIKCTQGITHSLNRCLHSYLVGEWRRLLSAVCCIDEVKVLLGGHKMKCDRFRQLFLKSMESVMNCIRFPQHGSKKIKTALGKGLCIALIVSVVLPALSMSTMSQAIEPRKFPDVPEKSWYASDLNYITSDARRILEGSSDGNFYPKDTLSVEQFLKCVVVAADQRPSTVGGYWAQPFIDKALQLGIITSNQFKVYRAGITRGEMAVIIRAAFEIMTDEKVPVVDISSVSKRIGDYTLISNNQQEPVCFAYSLGILTGMPDGKFHPEGMLSRAEAVAVIRRVIDPMARIKPSTIGGQTGGEQTGGDTTEIWSDAEFQAFMSTDEWKQYLNPNTIAGMKDGMLMFQKLTTNVNLQNQIPDDLEDRIAVKLIEPVYTKYYNITKIVTFYAVRHGCTATVRYQSDIGGKIEFSFSSIGNWEGGYQDTCFIVREKADSAIFDAIKQQYSSDGDIEYEWYLRTFSSSEDDTPLVNSEKVSAEQFWPYDLMNRVAMIVYGKDQGQRFSEYAMNTYSLAYSPEDRKSVV